MDEYYAYRQSGNMTPAFRDGLEEAGKKLIEMTRNPLTVADNFSAVDIQNSRGREYRLMLPREPLISLNGGSQGNRVRV